LRRPTSNGREAKGRAGREGREGEHRIKCSGRGGRRGNGKGEKVEVDL